MCNFLVANWLLANLTYRGFHFSGGHDHRAADAWKAYGYDFVHDDWAGDGNAVGCLFHDPAARIVALLAGSVYNFQSLQGRHESFTNPGDAIIPSYLRWGANFPRHLDGDFAVVLLDFARGYTLVATDTFATKSLWLLNSRDGRFAVATRRPSLHSVAVPAPAGTTDIVRRLEPNSALVFRMPESRLEHIPPGVESVKEMAPPVVVSRSATFEFDFRHHKNHTRDWRAAFIAAIDKRSNGSREVVARLGSGSAEGAVSLALAHLRRPHMLRARAKVGQDIRVLAERFDFLQRLGVAAILFLGVALDAAADGAGALGAARVSAAAAGAGGDADTVAAASASARTLLSAVGASVTAAAPSCGTVGQASRHSHDQVGSVLAGFRLAAQEAEAEAAAAAEFGALARFPFLDRVVVQEYLWLDASLKRASCWAPVHEFMDDMRYARAPETETEARSDGVVAGERGRFWSGVTRAAEDACGVAMPGTQAVLVYTSASEAESSSVMCAVRLTAAELTQLAASSTVGGPTSTRALAPLRPKGDTGGVGGDADRRWPAAPLQLRAFRRAADAMDLQPLAPPLSLAAANGWRPEGGTRGAVFLTSCMEEAYFWMYCVPFISSFSEAFGYENSVGAPEVAHSMLVATAGLEPSSLDRVRNVFHFVRFVVLDALYEHITAPQSADMADVERRSKYQILKLDQYLRIWNEEVLASDAAFVVCMDSDFLAVKPFGHVFEYLSQRGADVAFTYYDGQRAVPWGGREALARTKSRGLVRLQGGMVIMANNLRAFHWFVMWASLSQEMSTRPDGEIAGGDRWSTLIEEFKGPSQATLAYALSLGNITVFADRGECCENLRTLTLEPIQQGGPSSTVRTLGVPARILNDAESSEDGRLPEFVRLVHLKGAWWREVISVALKEGVKDAAPKLVTPTRSFEWNREAFELWRRHVTRLNIRTK